MILSRAAPAFRAAVRTPASAHARRYASKPAGTESNMGMYLAGGGLVGLAAYAYFYGPGAKFTDVKVQMADAAQKVEEKVAPATNTESPLDPKNYKAFKLKSVEPHTHNTARFIFELPDNDASRLPVASCVYFKGPEELKTDKGKPVVRPYTPTSASDRPGELEFVIKRYGDGLMSQHVHGLQPGDDVLIKGPISKLPWTVNEFENVGMLAGGAGITPMFQILQHALADPANKTKFVLLFGNVEERDILLRDSFDKLSKKHPDTFKVVHVLEKQGTLDTPVGFINDSIIKQHVAPPGENVKVLVCGPPPMMNALSGPKEGSKQGTLKGALKELGYSEEQVFKF